MSVSDAVITSPDKISCDVADVGKDQRMSERALEFALDGKYAAALKALRDDTREWWLETIENGEDASCDAVTLFSDQSKTIEDTSLVT